MTRFISCDVICAWCGTNRPQVILGSTNSFNSGVIDLDGRPGGMARSAILRAINECPRCGYCATDLSRRIGEWDHRKDDGFRLLLTDGAVDVQARRWLGFSRILEHAGNSEEAAWAALRAAWIGDDKNLEVSSRRGREECARLFNLDQNMTTRAKLAQIDVLRALGRFEEALGICDQISKEKDRHEQQILAAQRRLIGDGERGRRWIDSKGRIFDQPYQSSNGCIILTLVMTALVLALVFATRWMANQ
jgi:hypothetical protein